jgi:hypothetical protein
MNEYSPSTGADGLLSTTNRMKYLLEDLGQTIVNHHIHHGN